MANKTKSIEAWEKENNILFTGDVDPAKEVTADEFSKLLADAGATGYTLIDYPGRTKFLEDNGHEVTRQNLGDASLTARRKKS